MDISGPWVFIHFLELKSHTLITQSDPLEKSTAPSGESWIYFIISLCSPSNIISLSDAFFFLKSYILIFSSVNDTAKMFPPTLHPILVGIIVSDLYKSSYFWNKFLLWVLYYEYNDIGLKYIPLLVDVIHL